LTHHAFAAVNPGGSSGRGRPPLRGSPPKLAEMNETSAEINLKYRASYAAALRLGA
jgi:hypothetical protein